MQTRHARSRPASLLTIALTAGLIGSAATSRATDVYGLGTLTVDVLGRTDRHTQVLLVHDGLRVADGVPRPDGKFKITAPSGQHTLLVRGFSCGPVEIPVTLAAGEDESIAVDLPCSPIPCRKLDKSDPGCVMRSPEARASVGSACEVHPKSRLRLDVVPLTFGISAYQPGGPEARKRFPNARISNAMGCVVNVERWGEVAYCPECRRGFYWQNPQFVLHPVQPRSIDRP